MATGKIDKHRLRRAENRLFATAKTQLGGSRPGLKASGSHYNAEMDAMDPAFAKREVNTPDVIVAATLRIVERKRRAAESLKSARVLTRHEQGSCPQIAW